ncbi:hypothetical protein F5883DRAFT_232249 [Diaporthe sp. PMI_573]|nr:hypothetical protein F5883DRAFT_232249 [Diaporthaceae sp. PMI_573]
MKGRRTAWTCKITVGSRVFDARNFYDGHANAKEDAAEVAFNYFNDKIINSKDTLRDKFGELGMQ